MKIKFFTILLLSLTCYIYGEEEKEESKDGLCIGIDLGTTYSVVGIYKNGRVEIISNEQGNRITPSYVAYNEDCTRSIGDAAKNQQTHNFKNTFHSIKRMIGVEFDNAMLQKDLKVFPFITNNVNNKPQLEVNCDNRKLHLAPEEVSAAVLNYMKTTAEGYLNQTITCAVVTVPAYFNDAQRQATKDAGKIAGLNVKRIINEPTAAAIAYGLDKTDEKNVLVYDLGGGTFDVTLLTIDNGVFEVLATNGDTHLGGEDFDNRVIDYFIKLFNKRNNVDVRQNEKAVQRLRREVEKAKRQLSTKQLAKIEIEAFFKGLNFKESLTRAKFEDLNMDYFKKSLKIIKKVMDDADLKISEIDEVVLVGGSTRIPKVRKLVQQFLNGKEPASGINPDEAIAYGAAVQAGVLSGADGGDSIVLIDVNPLTLGIETVGGVMTKVIPRNSVIPTKKTQIFSTAADNQDTVTISVHEGERSMVKDNHLLGKFDLKGIKKAPRGVPQIEVTFEMDANSILHVTAADKGSGLSESIKINQENSKLSAEDIDRMINDAEKYADEDKVAQSKAEAKNKFESTVYGLRNDVNDKEKMGGKLSEEDKTELETIISDAIAWIDSHHMESSAEEMNSELKKFEENTTKIVSKYKESEKSEEKAEPKEDDEHTEL
ncbi:hypothetical protein A3Q56_02596 [Intoshia linei]|uniref:Uncharacterized protein n=1 Tax=Intoshia linei TaxID=1819745 RepID=A0A177B5T8_9BILA|nr:hypothetical protein A3Q56_02596 [Intoshia linei]